MEKVKEFCKERLVYFIYSFLFLIMVIGVFFLFIEQKKSFMWYTDGVKQHYLFLYDFNEIIRNIFQNGFNTFSLNIGLGLDVIGQYSYYVIGDPFVIISFFFPMDKLQYAYSLMIFARIFCIGFAYIFFCRYKKKECIPTLIGAIIYSFCGYVLYAGIRHPYFLNALILLPLMFIGVEKLIKEDKKIFLTFIIFISAISNYYFLYILTVLSVIYGIVTYIFDVKEKTVKGFFILLLKAAICYIIGILMSAIIFLPSVLAFLNSARTDNTLLYFQDELYNNFLLSYIKISAYNWNVIQISVICIPFIGLLLCKRRENKKTLVLLILITLMLLVPFVGSAMNGFAYSTNRYSFMSSFLLAYVVTSLYKKKFDYSAKELCFMGIFSSIFIILTYMTMDYTKNNTRSMLINIHILMANFIILIFNYLTRNNKFNKCIYSLSNIAIILGIIISISYNARFYYSKNYIKQFEKYSKINEIYQTENGKIDDFKEAINYIKENDRSTYRIAKYPIMIENASVLYNYNGISGYYSIGNKYTYNLSKELEIHNYTQLYSRDFNNRTEILNILGVKYFICNKDREQYVPYGYSLYKSLEDTNIYINNKYLSLGIFYDKWISKEEYSQFNSIGKQNSLIRYASINENIENMDKGNTEDISEDIEQISYTTVSKKDKNIELNINNNTKGELYIIINNLRFNPKNIDESEYELNVKYGDVSCTEKVEDRTHQYYIEKNNFVLNLGQVQNDNNKIELKFTHDKGKLSYDDIKLYVIKNSSYDEQIEKLKKTQFKDMKIDGNNISGKINNDKNGILQLSIPYSSGWKVFVDGKEQELLNVNTAFIGVELDAGEHNVEFKYTTPGLNLGIIISIIGFALFIGIIIYERKRIKDER